MGQLCSKSALHKGPFARHGRRGKGPKTSAALRPAPKIRRGRLSERNFHFGVAARCGRVVGGNYLFHVSAQGRPLLVSENDKSDFSARQVLSFSETSNGRPCADT